MHIKQHFIYKINTPTALFSINERILNKKGLLVRVI